VSSALLRAGAVDPLDRNPKNPVMTQPIKKRINTELFVDGRAILNIGLGICNNMVAIYGGIKVKTSWNIVCWDAYVDSP